MDIFNEFATDKTLENEGTNIPMGDATLLVARANNKAYGKLLNKLLVENRLVLDKDDAEADALQEKITIQVLAETVLLGWKNVSYQGKKLDYSKDNAKLVLSHIDFRRRVIALAEDMANFKAAQVQATVKN